MASQPVLAMFSKVPLAEEEKNKDYVIRTIIRSMLIHGINISDLEKSDEWIKIHE